MDIRYVDACEARIIDAALDLAERDALIDRRMRRIEHGARWFARLFWIGSMLYLCWGIWR